MVGLLAGSLLALIPGSAHAGVLTPRDCHQVLSGDGVRRLDVCARGWISTPDWAYTRGVVEMHTYAWVGNGANQWVDSQSQSITVEYALNFRDGHWVKDWGQQFGGTCRVNGPGGSVGCSVPNTVRVAFYGPQLLASQVNAWRTDVWTVSWRDDRGVPHPLHDIDVLPNIPGDQRLISPDWEA
jgi:hypothetical protein